MWASIIYWLCTHTYDIYEIELKPSLLFPVMDKDYQVKIWFSSWITFERFQVRVLTVSLEIIACLSKL